MTEAGFGEAELDALLDVLPTTTKDLRSRRSLSPRVCSSAVWSTLLYSVFSISMTLVNKVILSQYHFTQHMALLMFQNGTCVVLLLVARRMGWVSFKPLVRDKVLLWLPLNVLFVMMLLSSFKSLGLLSVHMATIFKNSTNVLITIGDWAFYGQHVSWGIAGSLGIMLMGAVMSGWSDLEFDAEGYMWAGVNCLCTAAYVLYMSKLVSGSGLSSFGRVYYNNALSLPMLLVMDSSLNTENVFALVGNGISNGSAVPEQNSVWFLLLLAFSGCVGFCLSFGSFQCVQHTSSTTFAMAGALNKVPLAILGMVVFNSQLNFQSATFVAISLVAGLLYAYSKSQLPKN